MLAIVMAISLNATNAYATTNAIKSDASGTLNLGTEAALTENFSNVDNAVPIAKNQPYDYGMTWIYGKKELLNDSEWFRYTADGNAYIFVSAVRVSDLIFYVYEANTKLIVGQTSAGDVEIDRVSSTLYTGKVQKLFKLQPGRDYLIRVKATS